MTNTDKQSRYLEYLPAIFSEDPFLGEFLLPFEHVLTEFEELLSDIDRYFSSELAPLDFLTLLARWVALSLSEDWDEPKKRQLVGQAVKLYGLRGTTEGLIRYLKIYNERITPEIREERWPGGMQIGVSSQIGGFTPDRPVGKFSVIRRSPIVRYDYYIVEPMPKQKIPGDASEEQPRQRSFYYRADRVKSVSITDDVGQESVSLEFVDGRKSTHQQARVFRRDGLTADRYIFEKEERAIPQAEAGPDQTVTTETVTLDASQSHPFESEYISKYIWRIMESDVENGMTDRFFYRGDTILIDEVELPYCFIVDMRVPTGYPLLFQIDLTAACEEEKTESQFEQGATECLKRELKQELSKRGINGDGEWKEHVWGWTIGSEEKRCLAVRRGHIINIHESLANTAFMDATNKENILTTKSIVEEVKPAHTQYYLKLTQEEHEFLPQPMQMNLSSTIAWDTIIG